MTEPGVDTDPKRIWKRAWDPGSEDFTAVAIVEVPDGIRRLLAKHGIEPNGRGRVVITIPELLCKPSLELELRMLGYTFFGNKT